MPDRDLRGRRIGFVGAGRVGSAMAGTLARHGAEVTVHARRPEARRTLAAAGCRPVAAVAELGSDNEFVISCLFSDAQFATIADELAGVLGPGSMLVSHTTGSPGTLQSFAAALAAGGRDVPVVDAPFSGVPADVLDGTLTVLLGGAEAALDRVEPVLRSYAGTVIRTGAPGSARLLKLLNNLVFAANVQVGLEVGRLAAAAGIAMPSVYEVFAASSGGTRVLERMRSSGSPETYAAQVRPFMVKDVAAVEEAAHAAGLDLGLLDRVVHGGRLDVTPGGGADALNAGGGPASA